MGSDIQDGLCISVGIEILVGWDQLVVDDISVIGIIFGETPDGEHCTDGER